MREDGRREEIGTERGRETKKGRETCGSGFGNNQRRLS